MLVLGLDAALERVGAALVRDGRCLAETYWPAPGRSTAHLLPAAAALLERCGLDRGALGGVAVTVGPGSYTGLRGGLATAKGMALALGLPAAPVGTLEALAAGAAPWQGEVAVAAVARRERLYAAIYGLRGSPGAPPDPEVVVPPGLVSTGDWLQALAGRPGPVLLAGPAAAALGPLPPGVVPLATPGAEGVRPGIVAWLGWRRLAAGGGVDPARLGPVYVGEPVIGRAGGG